MHFSARPQRFQEGQRDGLDADRTTRGTTGSPSFPVCTKSSIATETIDERLATCPRRGRRLDYDAIPERPGAAMRQRFRRRQRRAGDYHPEPCVPNALEVRESHRSGPGGIVLNKERRAQYRDPRPALANRRGGGLNHGCRAGPIRAWQVSCIAGPGQPLRYTSRSRE